MPHSNRSARQEFWALTLIIWEIPTFDKAFYFVLHSTYGEPTEAFREHLPEASKRATHQRLPPWHVDTWVASWRIPRRRAPDSSKQVQSMHTSPQPFWRACSAGRVQRFVVRFCWVRICLAPKHRLCVQIVERTDENGRDQHTVPSHVGESPIRQFQIMRISA